MDSLGWELESPLVTLVSQLCVYLFYIFITRKKLLSDQR